MDIKGSFGLIGAITVAAIILVLGVTLIVLSTPILAVTTEPIATQVTVTNAPPSVGAVSCSPNPLTPTASANTTINCTSTITDNNGYGDINLSSVNSTLFIGAGVEQAEDLNSKYTNGSASARGTNCAYYEGSGTTVKISCLFSMRPYVDAGTWTANISLRDNASSEGYVSSATTTFTVNSLTAFNVIETSINYGSVALAGTSSEQNTNLTNEGNIRIDLLLNESDGAPGVLNCVSPYNDITTSDVAGSTGIRFNLTSGFVFANTNASNSGGILGITPFNLSGFTLVYANASGMTEGQVSKKVFWLLKLPSTGVGGTCVGNTTFTVLPDDF